MKALSIKQPWAEAIARGLKTIETRTWQTSYRGDLLICSSKKPDQSFDLTGEELLYGFAICVVELYDIEKMKSEHEKNAMCDIYPDAFSWHLRNLRTIKPFPVKGQMGIFNIEFKL